MANTQVEENEDTYWRQLILKAREEATTHMKVNLDDFIGLVQGGPKERTHLTIHISSP